MLKEANENMAAGETKRSLELRQELLALEELYTKDTTQLRVAYKASGGGGIGMGGAACC